MQHELFEHPNKRVRGSYPFIVVLQADAAVGNERIVAPLSRPRVGSASRMPPLIHHKGQDFMVLVRLLGLLPIRLLRHPVGSVAQYRDDLSRALDWLFWGI